MLFRWPVRWPSPDAYRRWALASNFLVFVQVAALITHEVLNFITLVDNQRPGESLERSARLQLNLRWWFGIATNLWIVKVFFFNRSSYLSNSWYHIRGALLCQLFQLTLSIFFSVQDIRLYRYSSQFWVSTPLMLILAFCGVCNSLYRWSLWSYSENQSTNTEHLVPLQYTDEEETENGDREPLAMAYRSQRRSQTRNTPVEGSPSDTDPNCHGFLHRPLDETNTDGPSTRPDTINNATNRYDSDPGPSNSSRQIGLQSDQPSNGSNVSAVPQSPAARASVQSAPSHDFSGEPLTSAMTETAVFRWQSTRFLKNTSLDFYILLSATHFLMVLPLAICWTILQERLTGVVWVTLVGPPCLSLLHCLTVLYLTLKLMVARKLVLLTWLSRLLGILLFMNAGATLYFEIIWLVNPHPPKYPHDDVADWFWLLDGSLACSFPVFIGYRYFTSFSGLYYDQDAE